ncbi:MAG: AAA family ATPase [Spirochaetales bacterium]|nr:AAA family ATPase [Spirochaetales bacterium]
MIEALSLCATHGFRVRHDRHIPFRPGMNVIIGPNGSGKSTILRALHQCERCTVESDGRGRTVLFEASRADPQSEGYLPQNPLESILSSRAVFSSHGQIMRDVMGTLALGPGDTVLLDEPEAGQDLGWIEKLRDGFDTTCRDLEIQIIMASHHPAFWNGCHLIELAPGYAQEVRQRYRQYL